MRIKEDRTCCYNKAVFDEQFALQNTVRVRTSLESGLRDMEW